MMFDGGTLVMQRDEDTMSVDLTPEMVNACLAALAPWLRRTKDGRVRKRSRTLGRNESLLARDMADAGMPVERIAVAMQCSVTAVEHAIGRARNGRYQE